MTETTEQDIVLKCKWCGADVVPDEDACYGVVGVDGSLCCEDRVPGCTACEDGEAHPHEAESSYDE